MNPSYNWPSKFPCCVREGAPKKNRVHCWGMLSDCYVTAQLTAAEIPPGVQHACASVHLRVSLPWQLHSDRVWGFDFLWYYNSTQTNTENFVKLLTCAQQKRTFFFKCLGEVFLCWQINWQKDKLAEQAPWEHEHRKASSAGFHTKAIATVNLHSLLGWPGELSYWQNDWACQNWPQIEFRNRIDIVSCLHMCMSV